jgi:mannose-6-phosphate isomerase-like protein (cupin superfamily)
LLSLKESLFLVVLEGRVRITSGSESLDAPPGTLVTFEPGERHSVSSADSARILLLFAPWPGEGHYRDD